LKDGSELDEVTTGGRLFHTRAADCCNSKCPVANGVQSGPCYNEPLTGTRLQSLEWCTELKTENS